ncbi:sushi, von Willebrand factor type a, egf and pentraxin domain-containing 1 [Plakobranchus ocellatus]|uniref:Sushi, von Willebrand factor type a, egf and pentraxin domain-containing 1 n=1 Tax=Plakobranchus ocellatus TaxID=259542 RepID=A0AAV4DGW8_9GAST|nr:sushi, von Willebrand factor type a, egf and pentraxin domain-containing 1 [Plakobranchus ocellatus]
MCLSCARGMTTESEGTVMAHDCQKECGRGFYSWNGKEPGCEPCALDTFQPMEGQTMCEPLGPMPSTGALTCEDTSLLCYNGGWCSDTADVRGIPICQCQRGYEGFICQDLDVHFCPWHYICPNSSLTDENQSKFWQYNDSCLSAVCLNGGTCVNSNSSNSYECFCPLEYSGLHCETPVLLCRRIPCLHGACEDGMCLCDSQDKDCEPPEDPCRYHSCSFGSTCLKRRAGGYICKCQPGRTGPHCGDELSSDFDMVFGLEPRLGWDVTLPEEFMPSLTAMTVCMWLRPSPMTSFFTLVTFSASASAETPFVDPYTGSYTVFKLKQSEQLYIQFFVETVKTEVIIPSLVWTHLCFTWKQFSGNWQLFLNGTLSANGSLAVTDEQVIPQNTLVTIAPRNTTLSDWMIFQGRVSQFSIFSHVLTTAQIRGLANPVACNGSYYGDVISWNNVLPYALDKRRSLCLDVNECWFPSQFPCPPPTDVCLDQLGSYSCVRPQRHRDSNTGAGIRVWLERVGVATIVAVVVLVLLFIFVRCMRKRNIRSSTGQNSSVQLRQHVDFHGQANPGASSGRDSSGTNSNRISRANSGSHRSIVRSSGRKVDGPSIFRRTSTPEDTRRLLAVTDALEETVIFDQNDSTASRRTTSFSDERPQTEQFDGNSRKAESQQQNFIINANYTSAGTEQILYLTEKGAVHVSPSGEEPTPLTFRTAARGTANPIEFLRQKFPTLAFGRSNRIVQPSAYKSLKQVNAASMDYEDDDSKDHAMEDPYLVSPDDEIRELQADDANTDNFPGSSRPVSSSNAGN